MGNQSLSKNQLRRLKKKNDKKEDALKASHDEKKSAVDVPNEALHSSAPDANGVPTETAVTDELDDEVITAQAEEDQAFEFFRDVFEKFGASGADGNADGAAGGAGKGLPFYNEDDDIPSEEEEKTGQTKLSKKKRKQLNKLSVAELKAMVRLPEVVEWTDGSSSDPRLLVLIKAQRNVVPVPTHWSLKREYLSSKRGIEKPPFRLPKFIAETGITEMRDAVLEKQEQQTLKQKQRERVAPKMGKLDIDYHKLYDAFFRFQTKPELTRFGEIYYEGKETEVDTTNMRPGDLSDATKEALGMPPGAPPPWLINQQRLGPPPSYPIIKIPGLNAPPPPGGSWGFHAGGWGKPPVDEFNRPLYGGDVFGLTAAANGAPGPQPAVAAALPLIAAEHVTHAHWGELQSREAEMGEDEEEEDDDDDEEGDEESDDEAVGGNVGGRTSVSRALSTVEVGAGTASSIPTDFPSHGVETSVAGDLDLRKTRRGFDTEESAHPRNAYTVLQEIQVRADGFFGSDRAYDIKGNTASSSGRPAAGASVLGQDDDGRHKRKKPGDVHVALDPDSLQKHDGINRDEVRRKFEERKRAEGPGAQWAGANDEDLSEMIAQESRKRQKVEEKRGEKRKEGKFKF